MASKARSESVTVIGPQGIARDLGLTQPHFSSCQAIAGVGKISTVLRLQSYLLKAIVPLTYGEMAVLSVVFTDSM